MLIGSYTQWVKLLLMEGGKYLLLLVFAVLAARLWRRARASARDRGLTFGMAGLAGVIAAVIGYLSVRHSLSLLYLEYGVRAYEVNHLAAALSLSQTSNSYWKTADATGQEGLCLLFLGQPELGRDMLDRARTMRKGVASAYEQFYSGLYYFYDEQADPATPRLEAATENDHYRWQATKLLAIIYLEKGRTADATRIMEPFGEMPASEGDHLFVLAWLKLIEGKPSEAEALLNRVPAEGLSPFWKARFEKLRSRIRA